MATEKIILQVEAKSNQVDELRLAILNLRSEQKKEIAAAKKTGATDTELNKLKLQHIKAIDKQNKLLKENVKELNKLKAVEQEELTTIARLKAELAVVTTQWERNYKTVGKNSKATLELQKRKKQLTDTLKKEEKATGDTRRNVGNYSAGIKEAMNESGLFSRQLMVMRQAQVGIAAGFKIVKASLTTFKGALISTGIGAFIVALGSLVSYFTSTEEGAAKLQKILVPLKIVFGNISDVLADVGEKMVSVFFNPVKSVKQFINLIKEKVQPIISGLGNIFGGLGEVITNVFDSEKRQAGIDRMTQGGKEIGDSISKGYNKAKKSVLDYRKVVDNIWTETKKETREALDLVDRKLAVEKSERKAIVTKAKLEADISELRVKALDEENLSNKERLAALDEGIKKQNEILVLNETLASQKLELIKLENTFSKTNTEGLNEEAQAEANLINVRKQNADAQRRMVSQRQTVIKQIAAAEKAGLKEKEADEVKAAEKYIDDNKKVVEQIESLKDEVITSDQERNEIKRNQELSAINESIAKEEYKEQAKKLINDKYDKYDKIKVQTQKALRQQDLNDTKEMLSAAMGLFRENTIAYKAIALGKIAIDTAQAISGLTTNSETNPMNAWTFGSAGMIQFASGMIRIFANIGSAKKILSGAKFADGTVLQGNSHAQGGIGIFSPSGHYFGEAEGDETILSKGVARNPFLLSEASKLNVLGGGKPLFADGGVLGSTQQSIYNNTNNNNNTIVQPVLVVSDVSELQDIENSIRVMAID